MQSRLDNALTPSLNALLASLEIPLVLQCPLELSPSLILSIFESILRTRLPVSSETRKCKTHAARVEAMKIFIGVLEDDVLGVDVGLGDIDPRKLAEGKHEEVLRVAQVLCWLGKRMNYLSQDGLSIGNVARSRDYTAEEAAGTRADSPSMLSAMSMSHDSSLLVDSTRSLDDSQTTITAHGLESSDNSQDSFVEDSESFSILGRSPPPRQRSRHDSLVSEHTRARMHEEDEDSESTAKLYGLRKPSRRYDIDSEDESNLGDSYCHCESELELEPEPSACISPPVRTHGYLETIDFEDELRRYELRRRSKSSGLTPQARRRYYPSSAQSITPRCSSGIITRHTSPAQYTLALLEERARLLEELSRLRHGRD